MSGFPAGATLAPRAAGPAGQPAGHGLSSEVFHMAHCALDMGLGQGYKELKMLKTSIRKFSRVEKLVEEGKEAVVTQNQNTPEGVVQVQVMVRDKDQMKRLKDDLYQKHACLNTVLLNPQLQDQHKAFIKLTTLWLLRRCGVDTTSDFNLNLRSLPAEAPEAVSFIPEFIYDNVHHFLLLHDQPPVDRREPQQDVLLAELKAGVLRLLTVLMLTAWVRNPHLRARFAQDLELLLPKSGSREEVYRAAALLQPEFQGSLLQPMAASMSEGLFRDLPCKAALVTAIYSVFVSMEVTGEALHFDEKFSYRYPLNAVLFHLLRMDEFRTEMLAIGRSTHLAMAASQQPIYLKFVNILVNDGIRLLDDSLAQLRTLHQLEQEVASPGWDAASEDEKTQKLADMKKSVDLSTRLNLLSSDNVRLMEALTKLSSDVFVHQDMVDRMANMLDYFLEKVTGRERREYRVKESVQFQPRSLLQSLARIYANLSGSGEFVQAIARDGRSYHAGLFHQAAATLAALGAAELEQEVLALAARVAEAAEREQLDTGLTLEAPEEFLDPILATLMREPVLLPSSGKVLDRSTIAKHLLTDQSDPFNRQPLVLAEVVPQAELAARIQAWLLEQQAGSSGQQPSAHGEEKQPVEELNSQASKSVAGLEDTSAAQPAAAPARAYGVKVLPRIMRDLKQLRKEAPEDMMVVPDEADFTRIHVVLTGPADTPYEGGFFYFTLDCPPNYPEAPPKALIRTTDGGRVRFNPNLYREGKVCLSILGTWSGPGWTSALSLHSVLLSIQSLMNENPIRNEPGYDNLKDDDPKVKMYNEIIRHEVVRVAFLGMVLNPPCDMPDELHSWVLGRAPRHMAAQLLAVRRHRRLAGHRFDFFENKGVFRWDAMEEELVEVQQNM